MIRYITIIMLGLFLTSCGTIEFATGSCAPGYKTYDVCTINGEQRKFFNNEPLHAQKEMHKRGFRWTDSSTYHLFVY